jgi:DNA polymerase
MTACRPWLAAELHIIDPEVIVLLGATASKALLGPSFRVTRQRGKLIARPPIDDETARKNAWYVATVHPSAVLRANDRDEAYAGLVADLKVAADVLG